MWYLAALAKVDQGLTAGGLNTFWAPTILLEGPVSARCMFGVSSAEMRSLSTDCQTVRNAARPSFCHHDSLLVSSSKTVRMLAVIGRTDALSLDLVHVQCMRRTRTTAVLPYRALAGVVLDPVERRAAAVMLGSCQVRTIHSR